MSGGIQVVRFELRASLDAPLFDHVRGLTRPPTAYGVEGSPAEPEPPGEEATREVRDAYRTARLAWREDRLKELQAAGLILDLGGVGLDAGRETIAAHRPAKGTPGRRAKPILDVMIAGPYPRGDPREMSPQRRRRWARETLRWLQKRVGPDMVLITATAHFDETAPHLQALFVPIHAGKLAWKGVRDAAAERIRAERGPQPGRKSRSFRDSYRLLQDDYHEHVGAPHGLARGEIGSEAAHTSIDRTKAAEHKARLAEEQAAAAERRAELARATIKESREAWQAESREAERRAAAATAQAEAANRELGEATDDRDEALLASAAATDARDAAVRELGRAAGERDEVTTNLAEVRDELKTGRLALAEVGGEIVGALAQRDQVRRERDAAADALDRLQGRVVKARDELDELHAGKAAAVERRAEAVRELGEVRGELGRVRADTDAAVASRAEAVRELGEVSGELGRVRADTDAAVASRAEAVRERDAAQVASAVAVTRRAEVERELDKATAKLGEVRAEHEQTGAAVRGLFAYCRDELAPLVARGAATARAARRLWRARGVLNARRTKLRQSEEALSTGWEALRTYTDEVSAAPLRRVAMLYANLTGLLYRERVRPQPEPEAVIRFGSALARGKSSDLDALEEYLDGKRKLRDAVRAGSRPLSPTARLEGRVRR